MSNYITEQNDWNEALLYEFYQNIERIATEWLKLDVYPNQIEIISTEQMLDAYSAVGMPVMYRHWSFGKRFVSDHTRYKRGMMGLAYEIVINSNPCIAYCMETNTMMMQALVIAHASFGHNAFFKNNYLFQQWTEADAIIDYLVFARKFVAECEEKYGEDEVEAVLDACHALQNYGVDRYKRPPKLSNEQLRKRDLESEEFERLHYNPLWTTIPGTTADVTERKKDPQHRVPSEPQENILYFIEKNSPVLEPWKKELVRIVRKIAQYFYPQRQTQLMNEGFATFTHYNIMNKLYDEGLINDSFMMEFIQSHTGVVSQLDFDHPYYSGINPYALGFAMFQDIRRVCEDPSEEDREWFADQEWVGCGDWVETTKWAMANFKDESFIRQFLSPKVMRDFHMFAIVDDESDPELEVSAIHNTAGFKRIREALADQYTLANNEPNVQVTHVDVYGDRHIELEHVMHNKRPLDQTDTARVLKHLQKLWMFEVRLTSKDHNGKHYAEYAIDNSGRIHIDSYED